MRYSLFWIGALFICLTHTVKGQNLHPKEVSCIRIPNSISVQCNAVMRDYVLEISSGEECEIKKLRVFNRWGETLFETEKAPWEWYGGTYPEGTYMVIVSYMPVSTMEPITQGEIKTVQSAVHLLK